MRTTSNHPRVRQQRFTLLELLVAVAIVVIIVFVVVLFFANVRNVWQESVSATNAHEDARLALELIARDLNVAVAEEDDLPGSDIRFHQPSDDALWFITVASTDSTAACDMVEAAYRLTGNELQRAVVDQNCSEWNIYGDRDDADDQAGYRTVIDTVLDLKFACYDNRSTTIVPIQSNRLPAMVNVSLTLLDARNLARWKVLPTDQRADFEKRFARTFWKTVRLP